MILILISDKINITLSSGNIKYFNNLGYELPYHYDNRQRKVYKGEIIIVPVTNMPKSSKVRINVKCDYCGKIYHPTIYDYNTGHKKICKDSCNECKNIKTQEIYMLKYGTTSIKKRSEIEGFKIGRNKNNINDVYKEFYKRNLIPRFNDEDYIDSNHLLPYICLNHINYGIQYITYYSLKHSQFGCNICATEFRNEEKRYSQEFVEQKFIEKGYILLTKNYKNVDQKLQFICSGHKEYGVQITTFYNVLNSTNNCKECRYAMQSGKLHYNWKGGISSEREQFKISKEYKNWRESVFMRDDYTCQCCGEKGTYLEAHHLHPYSDYPELRTDINNGITLCNKCHSVNLKGSFHNIYTQYNNTPEQLYKYIQRYKNGEFDKLRKLNDKTG